MSNFKIQGTIYEIKRTQQVTDKFQKRELWLRISDGKYEQTVCFEFANKLCSRLDDFNNGDDVELSFSLRGRTWTDTAGNEKCFNSLSAFNINPQQQSGESKPAKQSEPINNNAKGEASSFIPDAIDDLPF